MNKRIYIAGRMRGVEEFNFPEFFRMEGILSTQWEVYNPARYDFEVLGINTKGMKGDMSEIPDFDLKKAMERNCIEICNSDAIFMLRGWDDSKGARVEHDLAKLLGLQTIYQP